MCLYVSERHQQVDFQATPSPAGLHTSSLSLPLFGCKVIFSSLVWFVLILSVYVGMSGHTLTAVAACVAVTCVTSSITEGAVV